MTHKNELISAMLSLPNDTLKVMRRQYDKKRDKNPERIKYKRENAKKREELKKTGTPFSISTERMEEIKRKAKEE